MKLGYVILYVPDVAAAVAFYSRAFGLGVRFEQESGDYAEMETGDVALAFAREGFIAATHPVFRPTRPQDPPPGCEIALIADDVAGDYARAVAEGAEPSDPPQLKPWGQTVAYVRDLNGYLVEICSQIAP